MAASKKQNSLPHAMYSPLTPMGLEGQSSLNSALANATEAAESRQAEDEGKQLQESEEVAEEQKPSHSNKNEMDAGESHSLNGSIEQDMHGGIEGGLQSQSSRKDSNSMGSVPEGDAMASYLGSELFETSELEVIEAALTTLRSVEGQIDAPEAGEQKDLSSNSRQDSQRVAALLQKVQAVKARKTSLQLTRPSIIGSSRQGPPEGGDMEPADIRRVVQAAAETALAAAKTAETVVSSLNRNSQAMEALCKALTNGESLHLPVGQTAQEGEKDEEGSESSDSSNETKFLAIELQQTEIAKSLVRQNRVTHWVLGFIVVSSLLWRYGVVKVFKKVNNTIQNPFQGIQDKFFPRADEEDPESERNELTLPQFKIPGIMGSDEEPEQQKRPAKKENEGNSFGLGRIFPSEEPETGREAKKHAKLPKQPKQKGKFNLGNLFSGQNSNNGRVTDRMMIYE